MNEDKKKIANKSLHRIANKSGSRPTAQRSH
jgi:hypothetical protein